MKQRTNYPEGYICNIIDKYRNGLEVMQSIQQTIENKGYLEIRDLIENAVGLPDGALQGYTHCLAPMYSEGKVGDLCMILDHRFGKKYFLYWHEMIAIEVEPRVAFDDSYSQGSAWLA